MSYRVHAECLQKAVLSYKGHTICLQKVHVLQRAHMCLKGAVMSTKYSQNAYRELPCLRWLTECLQNEFSLTVSSHNNSKIAYRERSAY